VAAEVRRDRHQDQSRRGEDHGLGAARQLHQRPDAGEVAAHRPKRIVADGVNGTAHVATFQCFLNTPVLTVAAGKAQAEGENNCSAA
jgi:hypothetical protein